MKGRVGRRPWGPEQERQHPRDDRGRFAKTGGRNWAGRMLKAAHQGAFGDFGHPGLRPERTAFRQYDSGHNSRVGRGPAGLIDVKALHADAKQRAEIKKVLAEYEQGQGGKLLSLREVELGAQVRPNSGVDEWFPVIAKGYGGGEDWVEYLDTAGNRHKVVSGERNVIMTRQTPPFEAEKAVDAQGERQMDAWRADASKPPPFEFVQPTRGDLRRADYRRLADEADVKAREERAKVVREARKRIPPGYYEDAVFERRARKDYVDDQMKYSQHTQTAEYYRRLADDPTLNPGDDELSVSAAYARFTGTLNRERPLAVYGDMLHALDYSQASHRALSDFSKIPAELHQVVAAEMFTQRHRGTGAGVRPGKPGIYVGSVAVSELDSLDDLKGQQPRGWDEGDTFEKVDGVFRGGTMTVGVGHTANARHESAAEHEFGHALDEALGRAAMRQGGYEMRAPRASRTPEFQALHNRVRADAGSGMSPYFLQEGDAGFSEFFAEAFARWARRMVKLRTSSGSARSNRSIAAGAFAHKFDLKDQQLMEDLHDYFLALTRAAGVDWGNVT